MIASSDLSMGDGAYVCLSRLTTHICIGLLVHRGYQYDFMRIYVILLVLRSNIRLWLEKTHVLFLSFLTQSLNRSLFSGFMSFLSVSLSPANTHTFSYHYCQAMNAVMPFSLWCVEYGTPLWNKSLPKQHHKILILAKTNIKTFHMEKWERKRKNHKMKVCKMLFLHTLIPDEVKLGIAVRQAVETISQLASLRS